MSEQRTPLNLASGGAVTVTPDHLHIQPPESAPVAVDLLYLRDVLRLGNGVVVQRWSGGMLGFEMASVDDAVELERQLAAAVHEIVSSGAATAGVQRRSTVDALIDAAGASVRARRKEWFRGLWLAGVVGLLTLVVSGAVIDWLGPSLSFWDDIRERDLLVTLVRVALIVDMLLVGLCYAVPLGRWRGLLLLGIAVITTIVTSLLSYWTLGTVVLLAALPVLGFLLRTRWLLLFVGVGASGGLLAEWYRGVALLTPEDASAMTGATLGLIGILVLLLVAAAAVGIGMRHGLPHVRRLLRQRGDGSSQARPSAGVP
jgi:hypothetical protein